MFKKKLWEMKENKDGSSTLEILIPEVKSIAQKVRVQTLGKIILVNEIGL